MLPTLLVDLKVWLRNWSEKIEFWAENSSWACWFSGFCTQMPRHALEHAAARSFEWTWEFFPGAAAWSGACHGPPSCFWAVCVEFSKMHNFVIRTPIREFFISLESSFRALYDYLSYKCHVWILWVENQGLTLSVNYPGFVWLGLPAPDQEHPGIWNLLL